MATEKKTIYIETSVVSYLTARPTGDLLAAAWQKITIDWWDMQRNRFDLYTSDITVEEARRGNPEASTLRLGALSGIPILSTTEAVVGLSKALLQRKRGPGQSPQRCPSYCRIRRAWHRLSLDVELPASR